MVTAAKRKSLMPVLGRGIVALMGAAGWLVLTWLLLTIPLINVMDYDPHPSGLDACIIVALLLSILGSSGFYGLTGARDTRAHTIGTRIVIGAAIPWAASVLGAWLVSPGLL
jgi:hypothetical protein